jgi:hypothetical protein
MHARTHAHTGTHARTHTQVSARERTHKHTHPHAGAHARTRDHHAQVRWSAPYRDRVTGALVTTPSKPVYDQHLHRSRLPSLRLGAASHLLCVPCPRWHDWDAPPLRRYDHDSVPPRFLGVAARAQPWDGQQHARDRSRRAKTPTRKQTNKRRGRAKPHARDGYSSAAHVGRCSAFRSRCEASAARRWSGLRSAVDVPMDVFNKSGVAASQVPACEPNRGGRREAGGQTHRRAGARSDTGRRESRNADET